MKAHLFIALALSGTLFAVPIDVGTRAQVTSGTPRSTLDRNTKRISTIVDVTVKNVGDRAIGEPLHAVIDFTSQGGDLAGLTVAGAQGGFGQPPHNSFFFDLSAANAGTALEPGGSATFTLQFTPPAGTRATYAVRLFGELNGDPVPNAGGPYTGVAGQAIPFDASASTDPDGDAITFEWNFADGSAVDTQSNPQHTFSAAGFYEAQLTVRDSRGAIKVARVPITVTPAATFGVARTRTLDGSGQPLGGVVVKEVAGEQTREFTSGTTGFTPLGAAPGDYVWEFSKPGYLTGFREGTLSQGATLVANPWLARLNSTPTRYTPLDEVPLKSGSEAIALTIAPGVFTQPTDAALTDVNAQSLPLPLPAGWSPLGAFHFAATPEPSIPVTGTLKLAGPLAAGEVGVFAEFDAASRSWKCVATIEGNGAAQAQVTIARSGTYVFVVGDPAPNAPPAANLGAALAGTTAPSPLDGLAATSSVTPTVTAASRDPNRVTAQARAHFTTDVPVPSGMVFPARITETYALQPEGTTRSPDYDTTVFAYHRPAGALAADFPLRPQLLFGPDELKEATVRVEVLAPDSAVFGGAVIDAAGGVLARDGIAVTIPAGALPGAQVAELAGLDPNGFKDLLGGVVPARAFDLNVSALGTPAFFAFSGLTPGQRYVLGTVVSDATQRGVMPLERFVANANGVLVSEEPSVGERLPGARGSGQFVLVPVPGSQGIISGIARDVSGQPAAGLAIRITGQPWLVFSRADGAYQILAPVGPATVNVLDATDGNGATVIADVTNPAVPTTADLTTGPTGPRVASTDPANEALNVRQVAPIVVRFSEPIAPVTIIGGGIRLRNTVANVDVDSAVSLDAQNRIATLLPANPLAAGTRYEIVLSAAIRDQQNLPIEGSVTFAFTTVPPEARPPGAQLVIYEPGAQNVPAEVLAQLVGYAPGVGSKHVVARGTAGTADPQVPVILVNENTGATATVLSKPDGSFASFVDANEEDFVSAVFVNANGTRIEVPATRQLFDNGRVGLYREGGILEAESDGGPVQVIVKPDAIKSRSVFKVEALGLAELLQFIQESPPKDATVLGGAKVTIEGEKPGGEIDVSFPADPAKMGLPPDARPEDAAVVLTVPRDVNGTTVYQVVDKLRFENDRVFSNTPPFGGFANPEVISPEGILNFAPPSFQLAGGVVTGLIVPMTIGINPVTVTGSVVQVPQLELPPGIEALVDLSLALFGINGTTQSFSAFKPVGGALVSFQRPGQANALEGRIEPGLVFATSERDGTYALVVPTALVSGFLKAVHPRLGVQTTSLGIQTLAFQVGTAGAVRRNIFFPTPKSVFQNLVPRVVSSHTPLFPPLGGSARLQLDITVNGLPAVVAGVTEVVSLVPGVVTSNDDAQIGAATLDHPDANHSVWSADITCSKAALVKLRLVVTRPDTNDSTVITHVIEFGGAPPAPKSDIPPADPNDALGPMVTRTIPAAGDILQPGQPLLVLFNEPIERSIVDQPHLIGVTPALDSLPALELSNDQRVLRIGFPKLPPGGGTITVTIPTAIRDIKGNALDQDPLTAGPQTFPLRLIAGTTVVNPLTGIQAGGGAVYGGNVLYVLDRANGGSLKAFDGTVPSDPPLLSEVPLPGFPRDLVFIPNYSFFPSLTQIGGLNAAQEKDLLVVVGGVSGTLTGDNSNTALGQYLRIYDVSNPQNMTLIKSVRVTLRNTLVTKVRWSPPHLAYLETGSDLQSIGFIDLQELILGFSVAPADLIAALPLTRQQGVDLNGDGDYTDPGEKPPIPDRNPAEFFGKLFALIAGEGTTRTILDFDISPGYLGVTLSGGVKLSGTGTPTGQAVPPAYQTLLFNGQELDPQAGFFNFAAGDRPKRLTTLFGARVLVAGQLVPRVVTLVSLSPAADGNTKLVILDITTPTAPVVLETITFPSALGVGLLQSAELRADGLIQIATTTDAIVLDPTKFGSPVPASTGSLPGSVLGILRSAGSGNISLGTGPAGLTAIALGARNEIVQAAPEMAFVNFPEEAALVDPSTLSVNAEARRGLLERMRVERIVRPARFRSGSGATSALKPASPTAHHHVLIRAPGGAGAIIPLALEALNAGGEALRNRGPDFAPPRAASADTVNALKMTPREGFDAPVSSLRAWRLSDDRFDPHYNLYLSEPFAIIRERITKAELTSLAADVPNRAILWSDQLIRATLDPSAATQAAVGSFAAEIDQFELKLRPKVAVLASTLSTGYVLGPNPPPVGGELGVPGSFGMLNAANGEVRHKSVDIELPSPRMPIQFRRVSNNQDAFAGPFGKGWDFNYNQRLLELKEELFPPGEKAPLIVRKDEASSVIAKEKDIEFHTGEGRTIIFQYVSEATSAPPAFTSDPLVGELKWLDQAGRCYLPHPNEKGVFDLIYRFASGEYVRLTPSGMQYRYDPDGRLTRIIDRYEKNQQILTYDRKGRLSRIVDLAVESDRFLDIGYFCAGEDSDFRQDIDQVAAEPAHIDKICRLKDYAGRDILFEYDVRGVLARRKGVEVDGANGGFSGRSVESYEVNAENANLTAVRMGNGANGGGAGNGGGVALFAANTQVSATTGVPVANSGTGAAGSVGLNVPQNNTAANVSSGARSSTQPDGAGAAFSFDDFGYPSRVQMTGENIGPATYESVFNSAGLLESVIYPEGNKVTYSYDLANPVFRSRPNIRSITRDPGPRGGGKLKAEFAYDQRYNLKSGAQKDFSGNSITYSLEGEGRDVESIDYAGAGVHSFQYNDNGQVDLETTPQGLRFDPSYDAATGFLSGLSRGGLQWGFGFDGSVAALLGEPTSINPPEGAGFQREYDARLQMTSSTRGSDEEELFAYDENGNRTLISRKVSASQTYEEVREFDQISFLKKMTVRQVETAGGKADLVTEFTPDGAFRVAEAKLPGGEVRKLFYNHLGHIRRMEIGAYAEEYGRDLHGNLLELRQGADVVRTITYDGHDRATELRNKTSDGDELTELTYFGNGETKSSKISGPHGGIVAETGVKVDALGRPTEITRAGDQTGPITQTLSYAAGGSGLTTTVQGPIDSEEMLTDAAGRIRSQRDSLRSVAYTVDGNFNLRSANATEDGKTYPNTFTYNPLDHLIKVVDGEGPVFDIVPRLDGNAESVTDAKGNAVQHSHSVLGEVLRVDRPELIRFQFAFDKNRQRTSVTDRADKGNVTDYSDGSLRMTSLTLRNTARKFEFQSPDGRNLPQTIVIPGGTMTFAYDLQGRATSYSVSYGGGIQNYSFTGAKYDALSRLREAGYGSGGAYRMELGYDKQGAMTSASYQEAGGTYDVSTNIRADGARTGITYPSGTSLTEGRQSSGRLNSVTVSGASLWSATAFSGAEIPASVDLGSTMRIVNEYDARKRLVKRRYERLSGGATLADMRFVYDSVNNLEVRQFVHAHGRADVFGYDAANRLRSAEYGARPSVASTNRTGAAGLSGFGGLEKGLFARAYSYDGGGLDLLKGGTLTNPDNLPIQTSSAAGANITIPAFASLIDGHDDFLHASTVDGFNRGVPDPLGSTTRALLYVRKPGMPDVTTVPATLTYNGLGHLVRVERDDGLRIEYEYRPDGLMHHRTAEQGGDVISDTALVWHDGRLLEEYDLLAGGSLTGKYYYADGDVPIAADFPGVAQRHFFLCDNVGSVIGLADASGAVVERVRYDAWGQAIITGRDATAPQIAEIRRDGNDLLVVFTEPVLPPISVSGTGLVTQAGSPGEAFKVDVGSGPTQPEVVFEENAQGLPFGAAYRLRLPPGVGASVTVEVLAGKLVDEWNNGVAAETRAVPFGPGPLLFSGAIAINGTAAPQLSRSAIGSAFLFHGQWCDYDTGLVYMRARFYEPSVGQFLQRDPLGYADSVNLYAAFGQRPTVARDPTGTSWRDALKGLFNWRKGKALTNGVQEVAKPQFRPAMKAVKGTPRQFQVVNAPSKAEVTNITPNPLDEATDVDQRVISMTDEATEVDAAFPSGSGRAVSQTGSPTRPHRNFGDPNDPAFRASAMSDFDANANRRDFVYVHAHADSDALWVKMDNKWIGLDAVTLQSFLGNLPADVQVVFLACNFGERVGTGAAARISRLLPDRMIWAADGFVRVQGNPQMLAFASMFRGGIPKDIWQAAWRNRPDFDEMGGMWRGFRNGQVQHELQNTQFNDYIRRAP